MKQAREEFIKRIRDARVAAILKLKGDVTAKDRVDAMAFAVDCANQCEGIFQDEVHTIA